MSIKVKFGPGLMVGMVRACQDDWEGRADIYTDYMFAFHIRYIYVKTCPILQPCSHGSQIQALSDTTLDIWFTVFWFQDLLEVKEGRGN